jgi:hypothetical protein
MPDPIELRHLKNLTVVAEEGNISRAAIRLYISQPCLSEQMKHLEETAQVCLLVRHRGGVRATPAAEILIAGTKQILKFCDDLLVATRSADTVTFPPMRLGFSSFVSFPIVPAADSKSTLSCTLMQRSDHLTFRVGYWIGITPFSRSCSVPTTLRTGACATGNRLKTQLFPVGGSSATPGRHFPRCNRRMHSLKRAEKSRKE